MIPGYATINLMAAYRFNLFDTKVTAQVNVTNLLDAAYHGEATIYAPIGPGYTSLSYRAYGTPRAIMGSLRAEF